MAVDGSDAASVVWGKGMRDTVREGIFLGDRGEDEPDDIIPRKLGLHRGSKTEWRDAGGEGKDN